MHAGHGSRATDYSIGISVCMSGDHIPIRGENGKTSLPMNFSSIFTWESHIYHHWKAREATTNVQKRGYTAIAKRWKEDPAYRETQREKWMDSRVLHFPGQLQNSEIRLQGHLGRKRWLLEPVRVEVERRKEPRKDVNSR